MTLSLCSTSWISTPALATKADASASISSIIVHVPAKSKLARSAGAARAISNEIAADSIPMAEATPAPVGQIKRSIFIFAAMLQAWTGPAPPMGSMENRVTSRARSMAWIIAA